MMSAKIVEVTKGKIRDKPISDKLRTLLIKSANEARIDTVLVTSGGQPGSSGRSTGSTRHNSGNAADLPLLIQDQALDFTNENDLSIVAAFVTAAARNGATGIGAGI